MKTHFITREIGIDMAHRIPDHRSKCRNLHGHRYTIHAACIGPLAESGEQCGMVLDFGFLKALMMEHIDVPCDHGTCLSMYDPELQLATGIRTMDKLQQAIISRARDNQFLATSLLGGWGWGKLYVVPFAPTAENLARHWFERLVTPVAEASDQRATLHSVKVWETPNCSAEYTR